MSAKSEAIRLLISLLAGSTIPTTTYTNITGMNEIVNTIESGSEETINTYLKSQGISIQDADTGYLQWLYEHETDNTYALINKASQRLGQGVLTEVYDPVTGEITIEKLPETYIDASETTKVSEGGVISALSSGVAIASMLADLGVLAFGEYQYETDADFRASYDEYQKNLNGYYSDYYGNNLQAKVKLKYWEDLYRDNPEEAQRQDPLGLMRGYLNTIGSPTKLSVSSILRVDAEDSFEHYAKKIRLFVSKGMYEEVAKTLYGQGIEERVEWDSDDGFPTTSGTYRWVVHSPSTGMVTGAISAHFHGSYTITPPLNISSGYSSAMEYLNVGSNDALIVSVNTDAYHTYVNYAKYTNTSGEVVVSNSGDTHSLSTGANYSSGYRVTYDALGEQTDASPRGLSSLLKVVDGFKTVGSSTFASNFMSTYSYKEQSPTIREKSEETPNTLQGALNYINSKPSFRTGYVDRNGTLRQQDWVQIPIATKDPVREQATLDDFKEYLDIEDGDEIPDYIEDSIITRQPQDEVDVDVKKPYSIEDELPSEYTRPSLSDIYPSGVGGTGGGNTPTIPPSGTGGGSPVIIPTVPIGGSASKLFSVYNPTDGQLNSLGTYLWSSNILDLLAKFLQNPLDAIITLHQVYVTPPTSGSKNIYLGYLDSGVSALSVNNQYVDIDCGSVIVPEYYNDARDYTPWTQVQMYLPFIGIVPLTPEDIINSAVNVKYGVDLYSGAVLASVTVTKPDGVTQTMYQFSGNCAVEYPLTSGNINGVIKGLSGAITGAMVGGVSGAVVGGLSGAMSGGASVGRSGSFGSNSGAMGYKKPYLIINRKIPDDASNYSTFYGYPSNKTVTLSQCKGYTRVKSVHVDNMVNATSIEKEMIESKLKSGVIIV